MAKLWHDTTTGKLYRNNDDYHTSRVEDTFIWDDLVRRRYAQDYDTIKKKTKPTRPRRPKLHIKDF